MKKRTIMSVMILLAILTIGAVSAAGDNMTSDNLSSTDNGNIEIISASDDEIVSVESDSEVLNDNSSTYSDLAAEIGSGGNIELMHNYYTYDSGSTIEISTPDSVINGKGAVIDMLGSDIQAFNVIASGVTIKNLTIKNTNGGAILFEDGSSNGSVENCNFTNNTAGGALYFSHDGEVRNCNFINNKLTANTFNNGGAIYMYSGNVENCNFINNAATVGLYGEMGIGGAVYFGSDGNVTNCNFTNNIASDFGGAVYFGSDGNVTNCIFTNNTAYLGGAVYFDYKGTVTNCNFTNNAAGRSGGAIFVIENVNVKNCNFTGCSAGMAGGAICCEENCKGSISNCSFIKCSSDDGGALYLPEGFDIKVIESTFKNNTANEDNGKVISGGVIFECILDKSTSTSSNNFAVIVPEVIISDDGGFVSLKFPKDAEGTVEVFLNDTSVAFVKIVKGFLKIDLSKYIGNHILTFEYSGDDDYNSFIKTSNATISVIPTKIIAGNVKVLYTAGQKYKITVYKQEGVIAVNALVVVKINNKSLKVPKTDKKGVTSFKVIQVPGTYKLTIKSLNKTVAKTLTVKHLVTLKKVTVKRSAKKLVLTATLAKVNKKYLKNKKITFKFNGKKYTAKTDKKGVAKVTIKSSVLKKLKKGKIVTYQATYLKDTIKQTVKV